MNNLIKGDKVVALSEGATQCLVAGAEYTFSHYYDQYREYIVVDELLFEYPHHNQSVDSFRVKEVKTALPLDSAKRKEFPLFSGLLAYFPAALAQVSNHSYLGNEKHNPGLPMQHARGRSGDHEDCVIRHLIDAKEHPAGSTQRIEELRGVAWRALALLQEECELSFAPPAPAATFDRSTK